MASLFTRIIQGEIPSHRIAESADCYAFLDINPVQVGHTLVVPKREVDYFFDLTDQEMASLMSFAKVVAAAIQEATGCVKVGSAVMGLEIAHAHIHLIPLQEMGDMDLYKKKPQTAEELAETARQIVRHIPEALR